MPVHYLFPALLVALILFNVYRRFQRAFGPQPVQPQRMAARVAILTVVAIAALILSHGMNVLMAGIAGLLIGAAIAILGLRLTRFEWQSDGTGTYTPNRYIGAILLAAVLARVAYRFIAMAPMLESMPQQSAAHPGYLDSPLTLGMMLTLLGYYVAYFGGILWTRLQHRASPS